MGTSLSAEPLLSLAVTVTSEQRVEPVLQSIVEGLAAQPGVALARIWLLSSAGLPSFCRAVSGSLDDLSLVASAGTSINSPGEDWSFLQGQFARVPFNVGKVGQVAASRHPILVEDVAAQNDWIVRPEWAKREKIRSFAGHPLIFRDKLLGVTAVFSRQSLGQQECTWLGLFANQAALAIANACAEEALRSSERNYAAIISTIPTAAWTARPDGYCDFMNQVWLDYVGMSSEEAQGWGWAEAIHPDDRKTLVEYWRSCLASGTPGDIEVRMRRFDGSYRWFLIRANPQRDELGNIVKWYGTNIDIEDRKKAEEAQQASERNLAAIINAIPTTAWTTRPDGYCDFLNQVWLDYTGMSAEQAQGWGWAEAIHPDDRKKLVEEWQSCLASGRPVDTEARIRRFDASYRWFLIRSNPLRDESGDILKWYGTCLDIEDRKRGEQALHSRELSWRQIVDNIPGLVATTGAMGEVEFLNRQTLDFFGNTTEELKNWALIDAVHPDDLPRVIEARAKSIENGNIYEVEHRCRRADGVYRWFQVRGLPVRNTEGTIANWYLLLTDIDDRKKAEEVLQSSERNLRLMIDAIPTFIHVLRTDGSVLYANRAVLDYNDQTLEDVQGENYRARFFHPEDVERLREERRRALARGVPFENEQRVLGKDGRYRWFLIRYNPLLDEQGRIDRWYVAAFDIEDRKKSEAKLRQVIDAIPALAWCNLPDGPIEFLNKRWHEYTGLSREQSHGWGWQVAFHPQDLPKLMEKWMKMLASGEPDEVEARLRRHDGVYRWFLIRAEAFRDESGKIVRWYGTITDIDDRKRAEKALQSNERNLSLIINTMPTQVASARPDGSCDFFNRHWLEYTGQSAEQAQGSGWKGVFHPDDVKGLVENWQSSLASGVPVEAEARIRRFDGSYRWFLVRGNPLRDESGNIVKWYATNTDIDDRKRAEARVEQAYLRLAEAQRLSKTGSFITDLLGDDHDWSEEAFRIFEFDPAAKVSVALIRNTIHPEDLPTFEAVIARGMTGTDVDFGFRIVTPRGALKHLRGMARVMAQSGGRPLFIGAFQDVTQSKLAEEALDKARSELAHVARITTLNTLTASIAHEVNQPLSGIVTNASTCRRMLDGDPPNIEGARETARRIIRDGNRASDVITRLRALFSKKDFTLEPLDLNEATREVIALSLSDIQRNRVVLLADLAADLPLVMGDRVQLQQVTLNLLRNACDAMVGVDDRLRELVVKTKREDGDRVRLSVVDAGAGFRPEAKDKLFEAFYTTKTDGMGIGLSVSRSIIERHHGRIWAEPNVGPGVTFSFSIPCATEAAS